jgi:hypothetical protein
MKNNQKGFGAIEAMLIVMVIGTVALVGLYVFRQSSQDESKVTNNQLATLSGTVTEGPITPDVQPGNSNVVAVANHPIKAENSQGKVVSSSETDAQGRYLFHLPLGYYSLVFVPQVSPEALTNNSIQLKSGVNTLNLIVDTGIR